MIIPTAKAKRGCGDERTEGGCYLASGMSPFGQPIEAFIIDPPRLWAGVWKNKPRFKIMPTKQGHNNVFIFVGSCYYPSLWDFVEETRHFGASRKVSPTFPFEKLTPGKSKMIFIHRRTVLTKEKLFYCYGNVPLEYCSLGHLSEEDWEGVWSGYHPNNSICTFAHRDLAYHFHPDAVIPVTQKDEDIKEFRINMAGFVYYGVVPTLTEANIKNQLLPGAFLALPLTHIEFCKKENTKAKKSANKAGYEAITLDY